MPVMHGHLYRDEGAMPDYLAETLLCAWGAHLRAEVEAEVGLPGACPSCSEYEAPDWVTPPAPIVSLADLERACWTMIVVGSRYPRLHRDIREHYRDGRKLGWQRLREGRDTFGRVWTTWDQFTQPINAV